MTEKVLRKIVNKSCHEIIHLFKSRNFFRYYGSPIQTSRLQVMRVQLSGSNRQFPRQSESDSLERVLQVNGCYI